jgi:UDP-3-O-[3-hydroxymyristoyl] glucosamine N-acyltransferase
MKLSEIAQALGGTLVGDGSIDVTRAVHPAEATSARDLALAMDKPLAAMLGTGKARVAILAEGGPEPEGLDGYILVKRPRYAMAGVTRLFDLPVHAPAGIHPSAVIEPDAELGKDVRVGPFTYIASGARVAAGTVLMAHVTIGADARIGEGCLLHPGVRIGERVEIGARAIIHQNASIGADGFSFVTPEPGAAEEARGGASDAVTAQNVVLTRINSLGTVIVGDDVEIGACTSIDRGTISATRIGNSTKIDDLVMIGHNVEVGENCMICGQVGIAGSTRIGSRVVLAGQVGVGDHLTIGDDVVVGACSAVGTNLPSRMVAIGTPAVARSKAAEIYMFTRRLKGLFEDVARLKKSLNAIESGKEKG